MNKTAKHISTILFGSVAWVVCAVALPINQAYAGNENGNGNGNGSEKVTLCHVPPGNSNNPQTLSVDSSAVDSHLTQHDGDYLGACADDKDKDIDKSSKSSSSEKTCVSLTLLVESVSKDKDKEDGKAKEEHDNSSQSESSGDNDGKADHDTKAKDHEDKSKEYADKSKEIEEVQSNCTALVTDVDSGTTTPEPGVWVSGNADAINEAIALDGGAVTLFDSNSGGNASTPDSSMESYREIRGE